MQSEQPQQGDFPEKDKTSEQEQVSSDPQAMKTVNDAYTVWCQLSVEEKQAYTDSQPGKEF